MRDRTDQNRFLIAESGRPEVAIVQWHDDDSPVPSFATDELQRYIRAMSGATIPVVSGTVDSPDDAVESLVAVVASADDAGAGTAADREGELRDDWIDAAANRLADTREDSFTIQTYDDAAVLAGSTHRSTLYAVYELLERFGIRFYAPDFEFYDGNAERVPDTDTVALGPLDLVEEPSFGYRRKDVEEGRSHTTRNIRQMVDWMAKTKQNVLTVPADYTNLERGTVAWDEWREDVIPELEKRGLMLETGGHGFRAFLPPEDYEETHPEWFVDECNVFDITDDEAVETYVDNVIEYLERRPEVDVFDAWPPDWAVWPPQVLQEFGSGANAYAYLMNELQDAVQERLSDRQITIEVLAYHQHFDVPDSEYAYADDVMVDFAVIDRSYEEPFFESSSEQNEEYVELMESWRDEFDGTLSLYEYYRKYSWHSLPVVLRTLIGREMPAYHSFGFDGIWIYSEPADWLTYELTHLQVAKMAWDVDLDVEMFVDTYLSERYGPAAEPMEVYFEFVEQASRTLFNTFSGSYDDIDRVSAARDDYRQAQESLTDAREVVENEDPAAFMIERLQKNAEFAVADTSISYYELRDEDEAVEEAKEQARAVIEKHCFDGVVLRSGHALNRCTPDEDVPDATEMIADYRNEWGG